jgi:hypothetical protein
MIKDEPRDYAVIDVETSLITDGEIPKTKFWGYADESRYEYFKTTKELLRFLRMKKKPLTLLHHSNFDIIQLLVDGADMTILKSHNGKLIKCQLGKHYTANTFSVFPVGMASIFKAFGYEKTSLEKLEKRNYEDCVNGLKCFLELDSIFKELVNVSPLGKGTIASTGFAAAELQAGRMPKNLSHLAAYRGGRVECFDLRLYTNDANDRDWFFENWRMETNGKDFPFDVVGKNCLKADIHSSYPKSFLDAPKKTELLKVKVTTKDWHAPLFDSSVTDMLLFPNGTFSSYVFSDVWERYIEPYAEKTKIKILQKIKIDLSWLNRLQSLIERMYSLKLTSTGGIQIATKFLLNSLYGRIGLKGETERARILNYEIDGDNIQCLPIGHGRFLIFDKIQREPRANFPFAAYITDNARGRLFKSFKRNSPVYGDTDANFSPINRSDFQEPLGDGCGDWGYEGSELFQCQNVKDYIHGCYKCGHKGILNNGKECPACKGEGFCKVRKGGMDLTVWTLKNFAKGKTAEDVHRERRSGLRKRMVHSDGTTSPINVGK